MFPSSTKAIMAYAAVSACSRAGLNLIDRYQIGHQALPVAAVNLLNNVFPATVMALSAVCLGAGNRLLACIADARTALFGGLVQLTAFAFSHAFRRLTVNQVTAATKAADLLIPVAVFFATGRWAWANYAFSAATTVVCIPLLMAAGARRWASHAGGAVAAIVTALSLQAALTPMLTRSARPDASTLDIFLFTTATIVWRLAWSAMPLLRRRGVHSPGVFALAVRPLSMLRAVLTVVTQITFMLAAGSPSSAVAWPILNSTGLLAMAWAGLIIGERPSRAEGLVIAAITALSLARFLSLPA